MLRKYLQSMLDEAGRKLNVTVKRKLKGNLHLALIITHTDVILMLARDKVYPSASEWKTTLANFPYSVPQAAPTLFVDSDRRFAMRANLPRREDVPQQLAIPQGENLSDELLAVSQPEENADTDEAQDAAV